MEIVSCKVPDGPGAPLSTSQMPLARELALRPDSRMNSKPVAGEAQSHHHRKHICLTQIPHWMDENVHPLGTKRGIALHHVAPPGSLRDDNSLNPQAGFQAFTS